VTLPFDTTKPESRPEPITFFTDEETANRLNELKDSTGLDRSLIVHRIVKRALEGTPAERSAAISVGSPK
jgi:hypothetical protein